ncbi:ycf20-like protein [Zingiber officinale]|uniref:ycf20-like protein n=1 Tax=Zingiber officinale TaxID=94328 RepID=UPI001C4AAB72|nr:ycf20-like protein [Zingiber officinale]XP_042454095.1 ycf20-like protein [Zingiber officinale]
MTSSLITNHGLSSPDATGTLRSRGRHFVPVFYSCRRTRRWRLPVAALITDFHLPMRSLEIKKRYTQRKALALGAGGSPSGNGAENTEGDNAGVGRTRLGTIVGAAGVQLLEKLNAARKNLPTKIFLLLLGFYTANALATILGQTGDWDVLVAGVVVAAIEGIGMLMYRKPFTMPSGIFKSLIVMVNYWKAGVCLGLFVDAFKLGS